MKRSQTILLTGASGFIGSHLLEALLEKGYKVVILKRSTSDVWRIAHLLSRVTSYDVDVDSLKLVFEQNKIGIIIHLSTLYRKHHTIHDVEEMMHANVTFPVGLLEMGVCNGVKAFFNTGTFFEYDCSKQPIDEETKTKPYNFYAKTKLAFESILKTYSDRIVVNTFRLFSPYGEKDNQKMIPMIITNALRNEIIKLSEGLQKLDFIYVADIVSAYLKAIERLDRDDVEKEYQIFNLGTGVALSVRDVVSIIEQELGCTLNKQWGVHSPVDISISYADITKSLKILNWMPEYSVQMGIKNTISYYVKEQNNGN